MAKVLRAAGHLVTQKERLTNKVRIPTMGDDTVSVYHVRGSIFQDEQSTLQYPASLFWGEVNPAACARRLIEVVGENAGELPT